MTQSEVVVFNGVKFRRYPNSKVKAHRNYFRPHVQDTWRGIQALHQEIWKQVHGPIPAGYEVHHDDGNPLNNLPTNLVLLSIGEHRAEHGRRGAHSTPKQLKHLKRVRPLSAPWHSSPEGLAWHREHAKTSIALRKPTPRNCAECGKGFDAVHYRARFCSPLCQGRARRKNPDNYATRVCIVCGTEFKIFKCELSRSNREEQTTCSRVCGGIKRSGA